MRSIIDKYLRGEATEDEEKELYGWLTKDSANRKTFKNEIIFYMLDDSNDKKVDAQKAFIKFEEAIKNKGRKQTKDREPKHIHTFAYKKYIKYASALVIMLASVYLIKNNLDSNVESNKVIADYGINVGLNNKIILTRKDGSKQVLREKQEELSYLIPSSEKSLAYNEIKVPKGQIFRLILSDSTIVWLNADTKLKYPEKFISSLETRTVFLEGEAFFEVSHNKDKPFIVNTDGIDIQVLGTKFNVSSYSNEDIIQTTLVEGSVNVIDNDSKNSITIQPSFQASFQKENKSLISNKVNTSDYTSWMQKRIVFNNTSFNELIPKIERTYNVEIINENEQLSRERFTGEFDIEDIETIFKAFSTSYYFEYEITKNKIIINKLEPL